MIFASYLGLPLQIILLIIFALVGARCSSVSTAKMESSPSSMESNKGKAQSDSNMDMIVAGEINPQERLVSYSGEVRLGVTADSHEQLNQSIISYVRNNKGYIGIQSGYEISFKIPSQTFFDAMKYVKSLGVVQSERISSKDITEEFYDAKIRLDNAEKLQKRLTELLNKATNIKEAIEIENELNRVTNQVDSLKGKMNMYKNMLSYSFISVYIQKLPKQKKLGPIGFAFYYIYKGISYLFVID